MTFEFLPRLDVWEHVCFVKGPADEAGGDYKKVDFYYNGKHKGDGKGPFEICDITHYCMID